MLYLISLGLNLKQLTLEALDTAKSCSKLYLENYTSIGSSVTELEKLVGKKIELADRKLIENNINKIVEEAKNSDIGILVYGNALTATTHISLLLEAKKSKVEYKVVSGVSILDAIAIIGLQLYKFGATTSIPMENKDVIAPIKVINDNLKLNLHTLVLLDLKHSENKFLSIDNALKYLIKNGIKGKVLACSDLTGKEQEIRYGEIEELAKNKYEKLPQCIIIPASKLHFMEKEALKLFR